MKRIYFVRHGESVSNVENIVQGQNDPLSLEGERQALKVAERAKNLDFDLLISSDAVRAKMTAEAIAQVTGKEITFSEIFREVKRPTSFEGTARDTLEYQTFLEEEYAHRNDPLWRREDAEHYIQIQQRAQKAFDFLIAQPVENSMVVTHGHFLRFLCATMMMGDLLTPDIWHQFGTRLSVANTGITVAEYDATRFTNGQWVWRIVTWNDHAHFAE